MSGAHHHEVDHNDHHGKRVAVLTAIFAVLLSVFTVCAHRAHTATIVLKNDETDGWSHYQAKRIRQQQYELNITLIKLLAPKNEETAKVVTENTQTSKKYQDELVDLKKDADLKHLQGETAERKTVYFDLAECVLEVALVLSSLYFLSHRKVFPILGSVAALGGTICGILGFFVR